MPQLLILPVLRSGPGVLIFIFGPKHQRLILTRSELERKSISQMVKLLYAENH